MLEKDLNKLLEDTYGYNRKDFLNYIIKLTDKIEELEKTIIEQNYRIEKMKEKINEKI